MSQRPESPARGLRSLWPRYDFAESVPVEGRLATMAGKAIEEVTGNGLIGSCS